MKKILIVNIITLSFFLSACGGGSGDTTYMNTTTNEDTKITIINCDNSNDLIADHSCDNVIVPDYYTCIQSGDTLVKDDSNTIIKVIGDSNDNKKVCVVSGSAHLLR